MTPQTSPNETFNRREPIAGYVLRERIGEGGFGEVWKADAPGGLRKAVKIVYGAANTSKAERELKALNRIKQVNHPLLLSLERIEVIDGNLVIVTELAERSLGERFEELLADQQCGIPRPELLEYMRDAADALDYLYTEHSLQHLDVKPENLLLLAGRIKVADFGMVKDLHEQNETLIGGLTPLYAPPEIYDGKPDRHSDQYSLAVVYQKMLTGEAPFDGRTAAQLAAQHLHSEPNVSSLPESDRVVIRRALSKAPERRFDSCRDLVDALNNARTQETRTRRRTRVTLHEKSDTLSTLPLSGEIDKLPKSTELTRLPELATDSAPTFAPTIFIGVGALAARTLRHVRKRIAAEAGAAGALAAMQFLLVDSDVNQLAAATRDEDGFRLSETVAIPLREPGHYRENAGVFLEWLERRWLYNVPRTLKTEGIRPLGRLAFVDNYSAVFDAVHRTIANAIDPDASRQSCEAFGVPLDPDRVRVFVVGSTTGGTGSGLLPDLSYVVRDALRSMDRQDDTLTGILLYATGKQGRSSDLQVANTVACLRELTTYSTQGSHYPGEPSCGIPEFSDRSVPFARMYLAHLGERLGEQEFDGRTSEIADFILASCIPNSARVFDEMHDEPYVSYPPSDSTLRSFSLTRIGDDQRGDGVAAEYLCSLQLLRWIGEDDREQLSHAELEALAERFVVGLDLELDQLVQQADSMTNRGCVMEDPAAYLERVVKAANDAARKVTSEPNVTEIVEAIDDLLAGQSTGNSSLTADRSAFQRAVTERLDDHTSRRVHAFLDWFGMLALQPKIRVRGVQHVVRWVVERLGHIESQLASFSERRESPILARDSESRDKVLLAEAARRFQQLADRSVLGSLRTITVQLEEYRLQIHELARRLQDLAKEYGGVDLSDAKSTEVSVVHQNRRQLLVQLEAELKSESMGLEKLLQTKEWTKKRWSEFSQDIRTSAEKLIAGATAKQRVVEFAKTSQLDEIKADGGVGRLVERSLGELRPCGGAERVVLMVPEWAWCEGKLPAWLKHPGLESATVLPTHDDCVTICHEMSEIPVENFIAKLVRGRPQCLELAERLHSRIDVSWIG